MKAYLDLEMHIIMLGQDDVITASVFDGVMDSDSNDVDGDDPYGDF